MKAADALTLVPMLCILMINARQRATQLNPADGDPQPWAQTSMYGCVAAVVVRLFLIVGEQALAPDDDRFENSPSIEEKEERQCDQQPMRQCDQLSALDKTLLVGHALASLALYGC